MGVKSWIAFRWVSKSCHPAKANTEKNLRNAREVFESEAKMVFLQGAEYWPIKTVAQISTNLDSKRVPITKSDRRAGDFPYYGASGIVDYVAATSSRATRCWSPRIEPTCSHDQRRSPSPSPVATGSTITRTSSSSSTLQRSGSWSFIWRAFFSTSTSRELRNRS